MASSPTSVLLGREQPRLFTPPLRRLSRKTSRGFEAIEFAEQVLGLVLHPWQRWLLIHLLELLPDGSFRFRTALVLVARQNGKTTLVQVLALWRMYVDGAPLVIGTAQNLDVAEEAWMGAVEIAEGVPDLAAEIAHVDKTNGKKQLRLETGERYKVAAASRRGGRGLSGDMVVLDELREHQTWAAWGAVTKTTMARAKAQIVCLSNAGDAQSVVLSTLRARSLAALNGETDDLDDGSLGIFEWSAVDGCSMEDRQAWAQANPSLGHPNGISEAAIRSALATDPEAVFRTEVLCQWVDRVEPAVIDPDLWHSFASVVAEPERPVWSVEVPLGRASASIGAAWMVGDRQHVEVVEEDDGVEWVVERLAALARKYAAQTVVVDVATEAKSLVEPLRLAGLLVEEVNGPTRPVACAGLFDAATSGVLSHDGSPELASAVALARWKDVGEGARVFSRRRSSGDITALYAVTLAHYGLLTQPDYDVLDSVF